MKSLLQMGIICIVIWLAFFFLWLSISPAQDMHAAGHNEYRKWSSRKTGNCCNTMDCRELADSEYREGPEGAEVLVSSPNMENKLDPEWCKIRFEHFIVSGKSPNAEHAHVCLREWPDGHHREINGETEQCRRILCFVGAFKS